MDPVQQRSERDKAFRMYGDGNSDIAEDYYSDIEWDKNLREYAGAKYEETQESVKVAKKRALEVAQDYAKGDPDAVQAVMDYRMSQYQRDLQNFTSPEAAAKFGVTFPKQTKYLKRGELWELMLKTYEHSLDAHADEDPRLGGGSEAIMAERVDNLDLSYLLKKDYK